MGVKVGRDEKDGGDVRRLLRRVTQRGARSAGARRQRSRSAHGLLQTDRSLDDAAVAADAAAAEKHIKLSNDELHSAAAASPEVDRRKGLATSLLSRLRDEQRKINGKDFPRLRDLSAL